MDQSWQKYGQNIQLFHTFARLITTHENLRTLNKNEMEILSFLYLSEGKVTPLCIAQATGMKKEAVSRSIKILKEKHMLQKEKDANDERSYLLTLTSYGYEQLDENYQILFQPYKKMEQEMGPSFQTLIALLEEASSILKKEKES